MKKEFEKTLIELVKLDSKIICVVADLGNFRNLHNRYPGNIINIGVSETNAINIAAGLATNLNYVVVYGVAGFMLYRAFEQIKFSIGYWNRHIAIIGTGFGWKYHRIGRGHHAPDDFALMQLIPNMKIYSPLDINQNLIKHYLSKTGPAYFRLSNETVSFKNEIQKSPTDVVIITTSSVLIKCLAAKALLEHKKMSCHVLVCEQISIPYVLELLKLVSKNTPIAVVEDHIKQGGIGYLLHQVSRAIIFHQYLPTNVEYITSKIEDLYDLYGFSPETIADNLVKLYKRSI